ncbi:MAG TPA: DNA-processing protein DprA [Oligoflexia bacterium]|nr:DNA-processing protein DprA [Oligoflexia bacterium]HMP27888.1 DNA-processing protein DprA [Oligoflexia bacterium]
MSKESSEQILSFNLTAVTLVLLGKNSLEKDKATQASKKRLQRDELVRRLLPLRNDNNRLAELASRVQKEQAALYDSACYQIDSLAARGIFVISFFDTNYPQSFLSARAGDGYLAPPLLYYRGDIGVLSEFDLNLAIVGSRRADDAGLRIARGWSEQFSSLGGVIVSGLALGVDAAAHLGALAAGGKTAAIIGSGFDQFYPRDNLALADRIVAEGGVVLTPFEMSEPPLAWNFLARNRLIALSSRATLVVQAPIRSGAISTANAALEENRELLVVPGDINDLRYQGSNRLIQVGAHLIAEFKDILEFFPNLALAAASFEGGGQDISQTLSGADNLDLLAKLRRMREPSVGDLAKALNRDDNQVRAELLELEFAGLVRMLPGDLVSLN